MELKFEHKHVLVIGDVMIDKYITGVSVRRSQEAPIDILDNPQVSYSLGGAANVAHNLTSLGADVSLLALTGDDEIAQLVEEKLKSIGLKNLFLLKEQNRKTSLKSRVVANEKQVIRIDEESTHLLQENSKDILLLELKTLLTQQSIDAIILQDYDKGTLSPIFIQEIELEAQKNNIPIFVDPKERQFFDYKKCAVFKPNTQEVCKAFGLKNITSQSQLDDLAKKIKDYVDYDILVITLSEKGCYYRKMEESAIIKTKLIDSADVSGAGDTFISCLTLAIISGFSVINALEVSNLASYAVCKKKGVAQTDLSELSEYMKSFSRH